VVLPFSLGKIRDQGRPTKSLYWRILRRTLLLFLFGLIFNGLLTHLDSREHMADFRIAGVLQRIAICYWIAAITTVNLGYRGQALLAALLLAGYWAILAYVPVPDGHARDYTKEGNLSGYIDRHYLPGKIKDAYYKYGDNEGLLSTIPSIATALLGVL